MYNNIIYILYIFLPPSFLKGINAPFQKKTE